MWFVLAFCVFWIPVSISGCGKKKKNDATKLKPKDMSKTDKPPASPSAAAAPKPEKEPAVPSTKDADPDQPKTGGGPAMKSRDADDNETVNEAKSDWGAPPKDPKEPEKEPEKEEKK